MRKLLTLTFTLTAVAAVSVAPVANAQTAWPATKPITFVVPFSAGGNVDYAARLVANKLSEKLKQSVAVENTTGAGGAIGVGKVVAAAPDGYTFVVGPDSPIVIGKLVNPSAFKYDPLNDLVPVALINTAPMILVARPGLPVNSYADFVKLAKASPGKYNYATSGIGTVLQLAMELLKEQSGIYVTHIPYRGGAQIATDVIGNNVDLAMVSGTTAISNINAGRMKGLGMTDTKRLASIPNVPTFDELPGTKGYSMQSWVGLFAPAKTPPAIVARMNAEINEILKTDDVKAKLAEQGALPGSGSAEQFGAFVKGEYARNEKIVKRAGIRE